MELIKVIVEYKDHLHFKWFTLEDEAAADEYLLSFAKRGYPAQYVIETKPTVAIINGEFLERSIPLQIENSIRVIGVIKK